jgi:hypothetical protein
MIFSSPLEQAISSPADYSAPLMRFLLPLARNESSLQFPGLPHPICSTFRFSQPLSGLLLESSCGLVSCHLHLWDSLFRVFPLKAASHLRQIRFPLKLCTFLLYTSPARECKWIVESYHTPKVMSDPTGTALTGINPLPSPFTSSTSFTRYWWPILS